MYVLGVESTAHTFGLGIVDVTGTIVANIKSCYSSPDSGMVPHEVASHHLRSSKKLLKEAFKVAKLGWKDIEFIAYSSGPGLDPALWVGYNIVLQWAKDNNKRLIGVNHCCAHLSIGKLYNNLHDPLYLYVSGVNTQVVIQEEGKYHIMGETLDIGLGNMLDKMGRMLGLGFPAGPAIEKLAINGHYVELPYIVKGMDVSFSGLLTRAAQLYRGKKISVSDLCRSVQETAFAMCTEITERGMANTGRDELLLVGGVGANKRFCEMLAVMCSQRSARFYSVPMGLAGDQGAMIAWEGLIRHPQFSPRLSNVQRGSSASADIGVKPHWRADQL